MDSSKFIPLTIAVSRHFHVCCRNLSYMNRLTVSPSPRRLAQKDRASIMLYLKNKTELHAASVYRLFFSSVIDSRNIRTDLVDREYIGYWRSNQGQWRSGFSGVHFTNPLFGNEAISSENSTNCDKEHARLRTAIAAINKMRPK